MKRLSKGCWTCRLRRKKCDEQRPSCKECRGLRISTCSYGEKPAWMDGGEQQEAMAEQIKKEIKKQAPYRFRRKTESPTGPVSTISTSEAEQPGQAGLFGQESNAAPAGTQEDICKQILLLRPFGQADSVLLLFYLERLQPFLFPFYRPAPFHGSRAWILDLVISSPVVRKAILCQSSYFFASAHGISVTLHRQMWQDLLEQANDAFNMLRGSIQVIESHDDNESLLGSVRAMAAIMQLQRFEIASSCFDNCQAHLNAAITVFTKIISVVGATNLASSSTTFHTILDLLNPQGLIHSALQANIASSEEAAFCFSTGLLLFDDIIASTALQEHPQLSDYHQSLLSKCGRPDGVPCINLESVIGCQNWVLVQIGEIAALDAWKKACKAAGNLDVLELAQHVSAIKKRLEAHFSLLGSDIGFAPQRSTLLVDPLTAEDFHSQTETIARQSSLVTQIWAHGAFLYLSVIASGWQPANADVRRHVTQALELLMQPMLSPAILRTMAWPICVIGCLAESSQQDRVRSLVDSLHPICRFSTLFRGFNIIEKVWKDRTLGNAGEFAAYFKDEGSLLLLV